MSNEARELPELQFPVAVVSEYEFNHDCPFCDHHNDYELVVEIDSEQGHRIFFGEVLRCNICSQTIIVMTYPVYSLTKPIFLDWSILKFVMPMEEDTDEAKPRYTAILTSDTP